MSIPQLYEILSIGARVDSSSVISNILKSTQGKAIGSHHHTVTNGEQLIDLPFANLINMCSLILDNHPVLRLIKKLQWA